MIKEARKVKYRCKYCGASVVINVLGNERVGKIIYKCNNCGQENSFYGEPK